MVMPSPKLIFNFVATWSRPLYPRPLISIIMTFVSSLACYLHAKWSRLSYLSSAGIISSIWKSRWNAWNGRSHSQICPLASANWYIYCSKYKKITMWRDFFTHKMCVLKPQLTKGWFLNSQHVSLPRHAINALKIKLEFSYLNLRFMSNEGLKSHSCWERMSENSRLNNGMCFLDISYTDTDDLIDRISQCLWAWADGNDFVIDSFQVKRIGWLSLCIHITIYKDGK